MKAQLGFTLHEVFENYFKITLVILIFYIIEYHFLKSLFSTPKLRQSLRFQIHLL